MADLRTPHIGNIVHYVMDEGNNVGKCRPAMIVRRWGNTPVAAMQLQVFVDGGNDLPRLGANGVGCIWKTSRQQDENGGKVGFWHFHDNCQTGA